MGFVSLIYFLVMIVLSFVKLLWMNAITFFIYLVVMSQHWVKQSINRKRLSFLVETRDKKSEHIQTLMGAKVMENCEKYLGLPMVGGKSKSNTFKDLREKITKRVLGWKEKFISKAGREILIKTVVQAIPIYSGHFPNPKGSM